ncbi:MAG TPA: RNA polymerase sigma factor [Polyangiaceae bacterium]|jgi:RNA polymerase sigma-70 factor (ECF subfamily)|nr:RNA polymerase sigma factor [Polyangiaceae bacterium]
MASQPFVFAPQEALVRAVAVTAPKTMPPPAPNASPRSSIDPLADEALTSAFQAGEPGAGARLYDRLFPVVDATLVRILGRREHDHADLVQTTFEQIVTTLSKRTFARKCSLAGWAAVLTCHVGLNALRSRRRERAVVERDREPVDAGTPDRGDPRLLEARLGARDELEAVRRHLGQMDPDRVTSLLLHAMGHDLTEIASLTSTSVAAAQSRLSRGRRELKARLDADFERPGEAGGTP